MAITASIGLRSAVDYIGEGLHDYLKGAIELKIRESADQIIKDAAEKLAADLESYIKRFDNPLDREPTIELHINGIHHPSKKPIL